MRMIGPVGSYRGFGLQDHSCWVHGDRGDYRPRLTGFFREGLDRGLRVAYLGPGNAGELRDHLGRLVDSGPLLARGAIRVISFEEIYGRGGRLIPPRSSTGTPPRPRRRWLTVTAACGSVLT